MTNKFLMKLNAAAVGFVFAVSFSYLVNKYFLQLTFLDVECTK